MKRILLFSLALWAFAFNGSGQERNFWTGISESRLSSDAFSDRFRPSSYLVFHLDEAAFTAELRNAPSERSVSSSASSFILTVPNAKGEPERFRVVEAPIMHPDLAARYPGINSYAGKGIDNPSSTIRFDVSPEGFHGMILSTDRPTIYIDPVSRKEQFYIVFARTDAANYRTPFQCLTDDAAKVQREVKGMEDTEALRNADDARLRTYRLALASTGEYSTFFLDGTETSDLQRRGKVLAGMNTAMTRTNGIYERDFGIRMVLIGNNDAIIYLNGSTDPWGSEMNVTTQTTIDNMIGNANYDIGHLVHRGANNGDAGCIGCVCTAGQKGSGFTSHTTPQGDPFVVDYLTHEMGHQFGANHTFAHRFEGTIAQCEPGSGSTIMGYAGITGSTTDVQPHSDDYFHARSIEQITNYIKAATCGVVTLTGNNTPTANAGSDYTIPRSTPFTLSGSGTDADGGDVLTYCWEQIDARTSSSPTTPNATATAGPVFRSYTHTTNNTRTFPVLASILNGSNTNTWEVLPSVQRTLNFRFTVRDNHAGGGNNRSDDMVVTVSGTTGPFAVTAPNTAVSWPVGSTQTVTWSVNGTNGAPVNCATVDILLSTDGGNTYPITLLANTSNDGSEIITVPNNQSTQCRIKVQAVGNVFFDISNVNFTINVPPCSLPAPTGVGTASDVSQLTWNAVSGATAYVVIINTTHNGVTTTTTHNTTTNSLTFCAQPGDQVSYQVYAVCSNQGLGTVSSPYSFTFSTPSGVATNLTGTIHWPGSYYGYYLNFTPVPGVTSYLMDWFNVSTNTMVTTNYPITYTGTNGSGNFFYYFSAGYTYKYRLRINHPCGTGAYSAWSTDLLPPGATCASGPIASTLTQSRGCGSSGPCPYTNLSWPAISGATQYQVEYVIYNASTGQSLPTSYVYPTSSFTSVYYSTLSGTGWYIRYRVRANCGSGYGNYSSWSSNFFLQ